MSAKKPWQNREEDAVATLGQIGIHRGKPSPAESGDGLAPESAAPAVRWTEKGFYTPLIDLNFRKVILLFAAGSILGLVVEIVCHAVMYGGYENRYGLVWGPFSPMYGVGAVVLTLFLNRLWRLHGFIIFLFALVLGSVLEYVTGWWMWNFFGATAWNYSNTFLNINGRVNLMFGLMWGTLGLAWVRLVMPLMKRGFDLVKWDNTPIKVSLVLLTAFLAVDVLMTVQAIDRDAQRAQGVPAATSLDVFLDKNFPTDWMQARFANMSIFGVSK